MKLIRSAVGLSLVFTFQYCLVCGQNSDNRGNKKKRPVVHLTSEFVREIRLRSIGPALKPGRIADIAVDPQNRSTWYLANASSGLWKTTNRGNNWKPVFEKGGSYSLGCVTIDPGNHEVIWLGTGENISNRSVGFGDGVYKSTDGGESWQRMGLTDSQHIGKILVDPHDSNRVLVAAEGPLWSPGGDRGVFMTVDGGRTWKSILKISENTGVTDIEFDPRDSNVIYAVSYQRRRNVGVLIGGGPESAIYRTTDGGRTWKILANGLPGCDKGRIAIAVSPQKPDVVYALVCAAGKESGFFRSENRGDNWTRMSSYKVVDPQYYGEIYADPQKFDRIYAMDMIINVTQDGGKHFKRVPWRIHVDNHAMVLDPTDVNHLLVGNDGGLYESYDKGLTWRHFTNLPTTQFYRVGLDNALPFYNVYGGAQDNGSMGGPSRTVNRIGIRTSEWIQTGGGDGFQSCVDPEDPDIIYGLSQNCGLFRFNKRTGARVGIRPKKDPDGPDLRWHWDTPLLISPHSHKRIYVAGNCLFRSDNMGDKWQRISGDLTRRLDPNNQIVMGRTWGADAVEKNHFTTALSVCSALDQSPLDEKLLYCGTDDGLVQVSEDGGRTWRREESFPGIPKWSYVSDICASRHDPDLLYAAFNNYQRGDFKQYLLKSHDRGRTWFSAAGDLPGRNMVWSVVEDHVNPNLLFAGTEFGLYFTVDGGRHWVQLRNGAPTILFRDLAIQRRENDLVAATFGRSFYVLDDYTPLRYIGPGTLAREAAFFQPRDAWVYNEVNSVVAVSGNYTRPNPPFGALLNYYLRDGFVQDKKNKIVLKVKNSEGEPVSQVTGPTTAGLHRVAWNLRGSQTDRQGHRSTGLVRPGKYTISLVKKAGGKEILLDKPRTIQVKHAAVKESAAGEGEKTGSASVGGSGHPAAACSASSAAQRRASWKKHEELRNMSPFKNIKWRAVGPKFQGGRIESIACPADSRSTIYVGAGSGSVWKTVNNGLTWKAVFEHESTFAIGDIEVAKSDPGIVWVGTGENLMARSSFAGTGVFKSINGGASWMDMGLHDTHHIGRIVIDPENAGIVYVAAIGHQYSPNEERGLFKTTDGGKTWSKILYISDEVGVVDVAMDPSDSRVLYASTWRANRKAWNFVGSGEECGIYKTIDGGKSWKRLTNGFPTGKNVGRIGLDISLSNPRVVYAIITNLRDVYRSDNRGRSWKKVNEKQVESAFGDIKITPDNEDEIFVLGMRLLHSHDGGKTFSRVPEKVVHFYFHGHPGLHLDHHDLWIDPSEPDRFLLGTDGGFYMSYDRSRTWLHVNNLPIAEFYAISVDNARPYNIYGGTQDCAALYGPSDKNLVDVGEDHWKHVYIDPWGGGDSYFTFVDPSDSNTIYYEQQFGSLQRKNMKDQTVKHIRPGTAKGEPRLRCNWMTPFVISHYNPMALYYGANKLFKSVDRGGHWTCISKDMTTGPGPERRGNVPYGTITSISESFLREGLIYVGTDDGKVQLTENDGKKWTDISRGLPDKWVSRVQASLHEEHTVYVSLTGYREDDFKAYLYMSTDCGRNWLSITGNLPAESINVIREDPHNGNLLYIGTDLGIYTSPDRGKNWYSLCSNLPTSAVHDIAIQPRDNELVIGTHGLSAFILDLKGIQNFNWDDYKKNKRKTAEAAEARRSSWRRHVKLKKESPFKSIKWRSAGPSLQGGRIEAIAVSPRNPGTIYVGPGSGNIWKTVNNGLAWRPVFEKESTFSIGDIAISDLYLQDIRRREKLDTIIRRAAGR